jgi:4-hydroxybenzoate polyprenyltransferase
MNAIAAYAAERFPLSIFAPALLLLTAAALQASTAPLDAHSLLVPVLGVTLIAQFRLWDDLEDVDHDRIHHPHRIIVNTPLPPFCVLLVLLASAAVVLCLSNPPALSALAVLDIAFWLAYRQLRVVISDAAWRYGLLLLKYPAFVAVMSLTHGRVNAPRLIAAMAAAYVAACLYELWHEDAFAPNSRQRRVSEVSQDRASVPSQRTASARRDPRGASS